MHKEERKTIQCKCIKPEKCMEEQNRDFGIRSERLCFEAGESEEEEVSNYNTLPNIYSCFSALLPTQNASYDSLIIYSMGHFQLQRSLRCQPHKLHHTFIKHLSKKRNLCGLKVQVTVRNVEPDHFGHSNVITFPERNHSEARGERQTDR